MGELSFVQLLFISFFIELFNLVEQSLRIFYIRILNSTIGGSTLHQACADLFFLNLLNISRHLASILDQKLTNLLDISFRQVLSSAVSLCCIHRIASIIERDHLWNSWIIIHIKYVVVHTCLKICIPFVVSWLCFRGASCSSSLSDNISDFNPFSSLPWESFRNHSISKNSNFTFFLTRQCY